jgi:DNA N-6-adenine-methyltransferase (Dam)
MDERTRKGMGSSESDEWFTPKQEFLPWHRKYNFETDPATALHDPLGCPVFFTKETNGLDWRKWQGNVWINPPYHGVGTVEKWIRAAIEYHRQTCNVVVMLLAARVETKRSTNISGIKTEIRPVHGQESPFTSLTTGLRLKMLRANQAIRRSFLQWWS